MVTILHSGDFHLGSPMGALSGEQASLRRREQMASVERMLKKAGETGVRIGLLAGDLLDTQNAGAATVRALYELLAASPEIRFFIAPGNHDDVGPGSLWRLLPPPENVTVFLSRQVEGVYLPELETWVYGAAFESVTERRSLLRGFSVQDPSVTNLMVLHGELAAAGDYNPISQQEIEQSGLTYLALGHIHQHDGLCRAGKTCYAYCGIPEPTGFDESGQKGYLMGEVGPGHCDLRFIPGSLREYRRLEADISTCATDDGVLVLLRNLLEQGGAQHLYRIALTGERADQLALHEGFLLEQLKENAFFVKVVNETRSKTNYEQLAAQQTPSGIFTKLMLQKLADAPQDKQEQLQLALELGLRALCGQEVGDL